MQAKGVSKMHTTIIKTVLLFSAVSLAAACSSNTLPSQAAGSSGAKMEASPVYSNTERYIRPGADLKKYTAFMIDPVEIYSGPDAEFGGVSPADQSAMADFMHKEFARVLGSRYKIVHAPGPHVLRIHLTLAGIQETQPALATVTHLLPAGLVINAAKGATGQGGSFMGSVTFAGDFYDSTTNELVASVVTRQEPNAMDVTVVLSGLDAAKVGATQGAEKLLAAINKIHGR